jgi:serine/threonine-protein kinase RsbW
VLNVPSSTQNLAMIREFVAAIGTQAGFVAQEVAALELAVDEACANVIEHAYGHDTSQEVIIRATFDDHELRIDVVDTGRGFDPASLVEPGLDQLVAERRTGGLGMQVIKRVMDQVSYEMIPGEKNELRMVKRIHR